MKNKNSYDRTGSSQDFSNSEGYHNYQDYAGRSGFQNTPHFADRQRSQYDDGMNRSERNDYRTDSDYRGGFQGSQSQRPQARAGTYSSDLTPSYGSALNYESNRFDSSRGSFGGNWPQQQSRSAVLHAGKGPKGYKRSDERIKEDVCEALLAHSEIDASEIEIDVKDAMVTLSGTVESRQIKRMVEDAIEAISGVADVKNDLRVMALTDSSAKSKSASADLTADSEPQARPGSKTNLAARPSTSTSASSSKSVQ